jgi:LMBR1 domain-containing protein 1
MMLLVLFFFASSISGIATIGIRFLWIRLFQIRKGHTSPQALLLATVMLSLIVLAINYAITMMVAPQYAIYGSQSFCSNIPKPSANNCTPSVVSTFLNRITVNFPFYGMLDFWAQFVFLAVFLIVFVTALFRTPKLDLAELDEDAEAEEEEGLLASTGRRFGATWQDITGRARPKPGGTGAAGRGVRGDQVD